MRLMIWSALAAFLIDQLSKWAVIHGMGLANRLMTPVFPPFLVFRYGENRGVNFGLFEGNSDLSRWLLIGFSLAVVIAVAVWISKRHRDMPWMQVSAGLVIGGALGNVFDRLVYGYVLDFLNMSCCGIDNPFVFNLADVFIFAGAAGMILFDPANRKRKKSP